MASAGRRRHGFVQREAEDMCYIAEVDCPYPWMSLAPARSLKKPDGTLEASTAL